MFTINLNEFLQVLAVLSVIIQMNLINENSTQSEF